MRRTRGTVVEIETVEELMQRVAAGGRRWSGWHLQGLDLTARRDLLHECDVAGALFLGCDFADDDVEAVVSRGGVVFPDVPGSPVDGYRTTLYSPDELYDTARYGDTLDARVYAWSQQPADAETALAQTLHDHAIDAALEEWVAGRPTVGVMGGHALARGEDGYGEAARLGHALGSSYLVATGGGPGAMEAANLGAAMSGHPAADLEVAVGMLAGVPSFRPDIGAWVRAANDVRERFGLVDGARPSLGIPTWHYGHEPPNAFATGIAKYFRNAIREAILLQLCDAGIVFLPGAGGTVQEIFTDACENYYADASSIAPMVLVGARYWTEQVPAWPLLSQLAEGRPMAEHVHLVDGVAEAAELVGARPAS